MSTNPEPEVSIDIGQLASSEPEDATAPELAAGTPEPDDSVFKVPEAPTAPVKASPGYEFKVSLPGHTRAVTGVKFSPDGEYLVSSSADSSAKLWDVDTASQIQSMVGHEHGVNDVAWSADGKGLASSSDDKTVRLWDVRIGRCHKILTGHKDCAFALSFNPRGNILLSSSYDRTVRLWDIRTGRTLKTLTAHDDPISSVDFNRDGSLFLSSSLDGLVRLWDPTICQVGMTLIDDDNVPVGCAKFSPNGKYILASMINSTIKLWNFHKPKCLRTYRGHKNDAYLIGSNFSITGGIWIVSGSEDIGLYIWNLQTKELAQKVDTQGDQVLCTDCHPTANVIASGSLQNQYEVKLWQGAPM
ncbi:hypothetical protein KR018_006531 [Drosophila ironensis]|nr:hypothetical protein KR018_006531 [Drosophila ironensis]